MQLATDAPLFFKDTQLVRATGMSLAWFRKDRLKREKHEGPAWVHIGGSVRYPASSVEKWVESLEAKK